MATSTSDTTAEIRGVRSPPGGQLLAMGGSGALYTFPDKPHEVLKMPFQTKQCKEWLAVEKRIYRRLGPHPHIIACLNVDDDDPDLRLERAEPGCIRLYFKEGGKASLHERIVWCRDLADTIQYLHDKNVQQIDIGGRNILLDKDRNIRLCDFAGSRIDDYCPTIIPQEGYAHPDWDEVRTVRGEIHALGGTIMELITGKGPYGDSAHDVNVFQRIRDGHYPDVDAVELRDIIVACWKGEYTTAGQVADAIRQRLADLLKATSMASGGGELHSFYEPFGSSWGRPHELVGEGPEKRLKSPRWTLV